MIREVDGDLIKLAKESNFDVIVHGCNCFCTMGAGIALQIKNEFPEAYEADKATIPGDIMKLGSYTYCVPTGYNFIVINAYTQYRYGSNHVDGDKKPVDYVAIRSALKKINHNFKGKRIGLPLIGAGLAGGNWNCIKLIIRGELKDMDATIVHYKPI